jgi:hypothetical protein
MLTELKGILFINALLRPGETTKLDTKTARLHFSNKPFVCIRSLLSTRDLSCVSAHFVVQCCRSLSTHRWKIITGLGNTHGVRLLYFPEGYDNYNATEGKKKFVYVVTRQDTNTNARRGRFELEEEFWKTNCSKKQRRSMLSFRFIFDYIIFFVLSM